MNKRFGFTLAEVLITLVIIGIVAAMTVPTVMNSTNSQEYRAALKKSISTINQALSMQYAIDGTKIADFKGKQANVRSSVFMKRMSVMSTSDSSKFDTLGTSTTVFYTSDGAKFGLTNPRNGATDCDYAGENPCYDVWIDVNGEKEPNQVTTDSNKPLDIYQATLYAQRVVPWGAVSQAVMYNK